MKFIENAKLVRNLSQVLYSSIWVDFFKYSSWLLFQFYSHILHLHQFLGEYLCLAEVKWVKTGVPGVKPLQGARGFFPLIFFNVATSHGSSFILLGLIFNDTYMLYCRNLLFSLYFYH